MAAQKGLLQRGKPPLTRREVKRPTIPPVQLDPTHDLENVIFAHSGYKPLPFIVGEPESIIVEHVEFSRTGKFLLYPRGNVFRPMAMANILLFLAIASHHREYVFIVEDADELLWALPVSWTHSSSERGWRFEVPKRVARGLL